VTRPFIEIFQSYSTFNVALRRRGVGIRLGIAENNQRFEKFNKNMFEYLKFVWNRWVESWFIREGILFLPIDLYFFTMLWVSLLLAYIIGNVLYTILFSKSIKGRLVEFHALPPPTSTTHFIRLTLILQRHS
jgi:hypothetical protein